MKKSTDINNFNMPFKAIVKNILELPSKTQEYCKEFKDYMMHKYLLSP